MATQDTSMEKEMDILKADLSSLKSDVQSLVDALVGRAQVRTEELTESARRNVRCGVNSVEAQIEQRPFTTVLIALAAGLLIGKMLEK